VLKLFGERRQSGVREIVTRKPAFAGRFYRENPSELNQELSKLVKSLSDIEKKKILGAICPHAAYMYSGHVAGELYSRINIPRRIIILSPNHTGYGERVSMFPDGYWETPIGKTKIDSELCSFIESKYKSVERDAEAHLFEHSLEVQLPFLQYLKSDFQIVPITLMPLAYRECENLGRAISDSIKELGEEVLTIASSDLNHYEDQKTTEKKDMMAIEKALLLDPKGLLDVTSKYNISMCGAVPTAAMLALCRELGACKAELLKHATSGDVSGDYDRVVGYAAVWVY
jgi:AmmeMemoRadiSam system protein B